MSALKVYKRSKGLDTGNEEQVLTLKDMKPILIYVGVQDVSLRSPCLFKEGICAGDADVTLWELGHLSVFQDNSQRTPLHLTVDCITAVRIGVTQSP